MGLFGLFKPQMVTADRALPGRSAAMDVPSSHYVNGNRITPPFPSGMRTAVFGMGCFWGAERLFWKTPGVYSTAVGYAGGFTENPTYEETCSGRTGHTEVVLVVYDPALTSYDKLLTVFWENHNPTQGMRQGNDRGTQYRSAVFTTDAAQRDSAEASATRYGEALHSARYGPVTTEIADLDAFYYAEDHHQQYLARNKYGYCGIGGTGVSCPTGATTTSAE
jgi:peptide-methionine (S)-S-oxide reductase